MKTIAVLHSGDLGNVSIGGVSQYIQEIIRHESNYKIILFGTCEAGKYEIGKEYEKNIDDMEYTFIPITNNYRYPLSIYFFLKVKKYFKLIEKCDVIYCQRMEYVLPFVGRNSRRKVVMAVHGSGAYTMMWRGRVVAIVYNALERLAINTCSKVIVLQRREEYGVPYYKKRYYKNASKIFFGRVPINEKVFVKLDEKKDNTTVIKIVYLGRIDDNPKRIMFFPQIAEELIKSKISFKFILIGDGPSMQELKLDIQSRNLQNYFDILGKIDHGPRLTKLLNAGSVALILSTFEGICMSALECIACGMPVVATDVGDIKEYIRNGENGIIIPNDNNVVLNATKAIKKIITDGCTLNDIYKEYSADKMIQELEYIFER